MHHRNVESRLFHSTVHARAGELGRKLCFSTRSHWRIFAQLRIQPSSLLKCKLRAVSKRLLQLKTQTYAISVSSTTGCISVSSCARGTCGTFCATAWYRYRVVSRCPRHAISNTLQRGNHRTAASFLSVSQWLPRRHRTTAWLVPKGCGSKNIAQPRGNEYHTPWYMRKISASKT